MLVLLLLLVLPIVTPHGPFLDKSKVPGLLSPPENLDLIIFTAHGAYPPEQVPYPRSLSESGKELVQHVAELIVKRYYNHFLQVAARQETEAESTPDLIQVTSIDKDIARESATLLIDAIKQYDDQLGPRLKMSLSKENIDRNQYFDALRLGQQTVGQCKTFDDKAKKLRDPKTKKGGWFDGKYKDRFQEDVFQEYSRMEMQFVDGQMPAWLQQKWEAYDLRLFITKRMKNLIGGSNSYWKFFTSPALVHILDEYGLPNTLDEVKYHPKPRKPGIHIHVVDDHLMAAILWWFKVDLYPQVGDTMFIEIGNNLELETGFIRSVDVLHSGIGYTPLQYNLHLKTVNELSLDLADFVIKGNEAYWLKKLLLYNKTKWERCCTKPSKCKNFVD